MFRTHVSEGMKLFIETITGLSPVQSIPLGAFTKSLWLLLGEQKGKYKNVGEKRSLTHTYVFDMRSTL